MKQYQPSPAKFSSARQLETPAHEPPAKMPRSGCGWRATGWVHALVRSSRRCSRMFSSQADQTAVAVRSSRVVAASEPVRVLDVFEMDGIRPGPPGGAIRSPSVEKDGALSWRDGRRLGDDQVGAGEKRAAM